MTHETTQLIVILVCSLPVSIMGGIMFGAWVRRKFPRVPTQAETEFAMNALRDYARIYAAATDPAEKDAAVAAANKTIASFGPVYSNNLKRLWWAELANARIHQMWGRFVQ